MEMASEGRDLWRSTHTNGTRRANKISVGEVRVGGKEGRDGLRNVHSLTFPSKPSSTLIPSSLPSQLGEGLFPPGETVVEERARRQHVGFRVRVLVAPEL
jgi:hypothetical protein